MNQQEYESLMREIDHQCNEEVRPLRKLIEAIVDKNNDIESRISTLKVKTEALISQKRANCFDITKLHREIREIKYRYSEERRKYNYEQLPKTKVTPPTEDGNTEIKQVQHDDASTED